MKAESKRGVICSPHPLATEAGMAILEASGTAIDAMLAASATLAAVYPHMSGLGGDALWLLHDTEVRTIVGIGQSGQRLPDGGAIGLRGPTAVATTAGALASWRTAFGISQGQWGSRMAWRDLLQPASELAQQGVPVSGSHVFWQNHRRELIAGLPDLHALCFSASGDWLEEGDLLRQPALADTLRHLARYGIDEFYQGELARTLAENFERLGCGLTLADLAATHAREMAPVSIPYRRGRLFNVAPPSQGLYTLQAMGALGGRDLTRYGRNSTAYYHALVESIKPALLRRNGQLHDPVLSGWDYESSLSAPALAAYAGAIDDKRAAPWAEPGQPADTVWMAATDASGRTACLIQSLFHDFGSGCIMGDTGVLWQNRAAGFNPNPGHPNAWAPGKRPAHTLNPSCYLRNDGQRFFFGTQGGDGQPQTQLVLATQLIDFDQPLEMALTAPRFLLGRSFFESTDNLKLESAMGPEVIHGLAELGHQVEEIPSMSPFTGQAGIISITPDGRRQAMHDPRGQGNNADKTSLGQSD